ncbi:MAG: phytase [Phycisphaerales bacterium]|nr:phytase [Phycisphaerales bacterium]
MTNRFTLVLLCACGTSLALGGAASAKPPVVYEVAATLETAPIASGDDAADDPAVWVHPTVASLSLIICTDKGGGLSVYDLTGKLVQDLRDGRMNNVDLRYGMVLGGRVVDVVAASNRTDRSVTLYRVEAESRHLVPLGRIATGLPDVYGLCMYRSAARGTLSVFVNSKNGTVQQWELRAEGPERVAADLLRSFRTGDRQIEGMAADDDLGLLYVGEEGLGVWRYSAEPPAAASTEAEDGTPDPRVLVDQASNGRLTPDIEGIAIYRGRDGTGYLIVSSQGDSTFAVYDRRPPNAYLFSFRVGPGSGPGGEVDGVTTTDGLEVVSVPLGPAFPQGALVVQDDENPGHTQNLKLVPWPAVAGLPPTPLIVDTSVDPRRAPGAPPPAVSADPR